MFLQITSAVLVGTYYFALKVGLPIFLLGSTWRGDCSDVDRCWCLSVSLLNEGKNTTYVCTSKLSTQLPLWSNNKQCAECPPLFENVPKLSRADACEESAFGQMDGLAGEYLDFWSGEEKVRPSVDFLRIVSTEHHKLADMNGPYNRTCSESRRNNNRGRAGQAGNYYCVDCFGADCSNRSFSHREAANAGTS